MTEPIVVPARRAAVVFILITVLLDMLALGMIIPVLPKLIETFRGGDTARAATTIAVFGTAWAAIQFFASPVLGSLRPISPTRRWSALTSMPAMNDEKCASLACTQRCSISLASVGMVNSRSAGSFISDVAPPASVTTMGSATESMMRFRRSLSARACTSAIRILR